jgi:hypothetical protein
MEEMKMKCDTSQKTLETDRLLAPSCYSQLNQPWQICLLLSGEWRFFFLFISFLLLFFRRKEMENKIITFSLSQVGEEQGSESGQFAFYSSPNHPHACPLVSPKEKSNCYVEG